MLHGEIGLGNPLGALRLNLEPSRNACNTFSINYNMLLSYKSSVNPTKIALLNYEKYSAVIWGEHSKLSSVPQIFIVYSMIKIEARKGRERGYSELPY